MNSRRPGRPRGAGVFVDEDLLELALDALAVGGFRGLSMRGLARELGVSLASVQNRYSTKDDLWRAAIDHMFAGASSMQFGTPLPEVVRHRMAQSSGRPSLLFALLTDDAPGHEERSAHLAERIRPIADDARRTFDTGRASGITRPVDVGALVAFMLVGVGAVVAIPQPMRDAIGLGSDEQTADGFADILFNGIAARPPRPSDSVAG